MKLDLLYFAWVRERVGHPREQIETNATTVSELIIDLRGRDARYDVAFSDPKAIRVALDQELSEPGASLSGVREVAFFPPMTGG